MLKYRDLKLPKIEGHQYEEVLFENNITPYFDMFEIAQFYPDFALKVQEGDIIVAGKNFGMSRWPASVTNRSTTRKI